MKEAFDPAHSFARSIIRLAVDTFTPVMALISSKDLLLCKRNVITLACSWAVVFRAS